jgi:hypothetical protein
MWLGALYALGLIGFGSGVWYYRYACATTMTLVLTCLTVLIWPIFAPFVFVVWLWDL